jgi:DNA-binding MarR family transcriptional regulator
MGRPMVDEVRGFNRFYTATIGVLNEKLVESPYSLAEARVLFELAQRDRTGVAELRRGLGLDAGYLSRILGRLEASGLAARARSAADGRRQVITLTEAGRAAFTALDAAAAAGSTPGPASSWASGSRTPLRAGPGQRTVAPRAVAAD